MGDLDYIFAVARIRVKEKSLLSDADIRHLIGLPDAKTAAAWLEDKGWGTGDDSGDIDKMLKAEEDKTRELIRELKVPSSVMEALTFQQLYHNLKAGIKQTMDSERHYGIFYALDDYGEEKMLRILKDKKFEELPKHMRAAAAEAYEIMLTARDGQRCDNIIDRACLEAMIASGKASGSPLIRDYTESTAAVSDIRIAVRAQKTGKNAAFLREALAPCAAFDVKELASAAAKNEEALFSFLNNHGFKEAVEAVKDSPSAFERWCDNRLIATIKPQKGNPVSVGPVVAYYLARQNEIRTVRILLTAKANGFSEEETRERVRDMYV